MYFTPYLPVSTCRILLIGLFISVLFSFTQCGKNKAAPKEPEFIKFRIDGKDTSFTYCRIHITGKTDNYGMHSLAIIGADDFHYGFPVNTGFIAITTHDLEPPKEQMYRAEYIYPENFPERKYIKASLNYRGSGNANEYSSNSFNGDKLNPVSIQLTRVNLNDGYVEGTFEGVARAIGSPTQSVNITDGHFRAFNPERSK